MSNEYYNATVGLAGELPFARADHLAMFSRLGSGRMVMCVQGLKRSMYIVRKHMSDFDQCGTVTLHKALFLRLDGKHSRNLINEHRQLPGYGLK